MRTLLAIESSTDLASVALYVADPDGRRAGRLLSREVSGVQSHSQTLLPMVQMLLAEAGITLAQCEAIAFGAGPGSFTGVRTACGIAQGLAYGSGRPVVAVDTLAAAAQACRDATGAADVVAVLDARMGEVYWGQYRWESTGDGPQWRALTPAQVSAPEAVVVSGPATVCGNGLALSGVLNACMPHALAVATLAQTMLAQGLAVAARDARPVYLRNEVALTTAQRDLARERKHAALVP